MPKPNPNDRVTIQSLRLTIKESLELLGNYDNRISNDLVRSMLQAAYDNTDPKLLDKDCGCA